MTEGNKGTRISKVARELNVGLTTIVEFLNSKGADLDSNPNNKISDDQHKILLKEYGSDLNLKNKSKSITLKNNKEAVSVKPEIVDNSPVEEEKELIIKGNIKSNDNFISSKPKESVDIKIVGKIDLNQKKQPIPTPSQKPEVKVAIEKKEAPKAESAPIKKEAPKKVAEPIIEKPVKAIHKEAKTEKAEISENQNTKVIKEEPIKEQTPIVKSPSKEEVKTVDDNTVHTTEKTVIKDTVKVVGRIDLDALNSKTRPAKKTKKQKEDERKERDRVRTDDKKPRFQGAAKKPGTEGTDAKPAVGARPPRTGDRPFPRTGTPVNTTPRVAGAAGAGAVGANDPRKKRKRIKKVEGKVDVNAPARPASGIGTPGSATPGVKRPPFDKNKKRPLAARPIRQEVKEEDVQKQIKETLARLTTKTKNKGSKHRKDKREAYSQKQYEEQAQFEKEKNILKVTEFVSVSELASMMNVQPTQVIGTCMSMGLFVSINQRLDAETIGMVADEFNFKIEFISIEVQEAIKEEDDLEEDLVFRAPIVTVMGHVDHGKTSLLDQIRHANVIAGEAGGITQHIGAYNVKLDGDKQITFLDTPGHEAFTAMRARGAQVTDIAIIIIAADDSIMPQTVEAINHASAAGVPIVFAINKIDKAGANPEKIKESLAQMNYLVEDWGGKYQSQEISAKSGLNVELLLEKVLLESEMLNLRANPTKMASGSVIESALDKGRGFVSTILVQNGTLKVGDNLLCGGYYGKVKAMFNERNNKVEEAGPATPVLILGLNGAPQAGDNFNVMKTEREAKEIATKRQQLQREQGLRTTKHITLAEIGRRIAIGNFQELNVIVKGDVDGSIEALSDSLIKLSTEEIQVNVIHKGVGQISESDVMLASASDAIIIGFQVRPSVSARKVAEREEIDIRLYSIIYDAINELKDAMEGMLSPEIKEEITSTIEIREVFNITKVGNIAGCMVKEGKIKRNSKIRVIRDGIVIHTGGLGALKRFKDDVKEVASGYECGLNIDKFNDIKEGDIIEAYEEVEVKKKL